MPLLKATEINNGFDKKKDLEKNSIYNFYSVSQSVFTFSQFSGPNPEPGAGWA